MEREQAIELAEKLYGDVSGIKTVGLNNEPEFFDCIVDTIMYIDAHFKKPINFSDFKDQQEFLATREQISKKLGEELEQKDEYSFLEVYLTRLYDVLSSGGIDLTNCSKEDIKEITFNGNASTHNCKKYVDFSKSDRETVFDNYKNLDEDKKLEFKQELRKKVITHEFAHTSRSRKDEFKDYLYIKPFEELLVERMAIKVQNLKRRVLSVQQNDNGEQFINIIPNRDCANLRMYPIGELLSIIVGEEEMQQARLLGAHKFFSVVSTALDFNFDEMKRLGDLVDGVSVESYAESVASDIGMEFAENETNENIKLRMELEAELMLVKVFHKQTLAKLENIDKLDTAEIVKLYDNCADIRSCVLKYVDKEKQMSMPIIQLLKQVVDKLDDVAIKKGLNPDDIKQAVINKNNENNNHYINTTQPKPSIKK